MAKSKLPTVHTSEAEISECGKYRYDLIRVWGSKLASPSNYYALFIGLNPSTADASEDDPTIRRMLGFSRDWNCSGMIVTNLFSYRATDPKELKKAGYPVGERTHFLTMLHAVNTYCKHVVLCWGNTDTKGRAEEVLKGLHDRQKILSRIGQKMDICCLGLTKGGRPKHPLYLSRDTELVEYDLEGVV